jgi:hypothetical protein
VTTVAVDPGGVTGIAVWNGTHRCLEVPGGFVGFVEWSQDQDWSVVTDLIVEDFIVNAATHRKDATAYRTTNDIIGACRYIANVRCIHYRTQPPSAKTFGDDAKLRRLGWFSPSKGGHRNDASRHLLRHLAHSRTPEILDALRNP